MLLASSILMSKAIPILSQDPFFVNEHPSLSSLFYSISGYLPPQFLPEEEEEK
jgi:hypothetical protein